MSLKNSFVRYAEDANGLQKSVGISVGFIALAVSLINSILVLQVQGGNVRSAFLGPYSLPIYLTGLIAIVSGVWISRIGKWLQVGLFMATSLLAAMTTRSGDLTSGAFLIYGIILIYQYNLGKIAALITAVFLLVPYPLALASGFRKLNNNYIINTAETVFGVLCLILLYSFVFLRHEIRHRQDKALLETRVKERTAELEASLAERSVMLHEIHHRVRNNLQIIISMLRLETEGSASRPSSSCLDTSIQRIYAMALVHETLYGEERLDGLDLARYVRDLLGSERDAIPPNLYIEAREAISVSLDFAVPFGLFINELIALVSLEEARSGMRPLVRLRLEAAGSLRLIVDGAGSSIEAILRAEIEGPSTQGFVHILVQQLKGSIMDSKPGEAGLWLEFPARLGTGT